MARDAQCPKCSASLPRKGRFCLECGLDLYAEGVRQAPSPWPLILVGVGVAAVVVAVLATRRSPKPEDPEVQEVRARTRELLALVGDGKYQDIVRRFYEPDAARFKETGDKLHDVLRVKGAQGLLFFRTSCRDDPKEAENLMQKYGSEAQQDHRQYLLGLLAALAFQEEGGARSFSIGAALTQRAEGFLTWYLDFAFKGTDPQGAQITELGWKGGDADNILEAKIRYAQPPKVVPGLPDPAVIPWRRLPSGKWALAFGESDHHFDELLGFLQRLKP